MSLSLNTSAMKKISTLILALLLIASALLTHPSQALSMGYPPATITVFVVDENSNPLSGASWTVTGSGFIDPSGGAGVSTAHTVHSSSFGSYLVSGYPSEFGGKIFGSIVTSDGPGPSVYLESGQNKTVTIQYASGPVPCTIDLKGNGADSITVEPGSPVSLTWTSSGTLGTGAVGFNTSGAVQNTFGVTVNPTQSTMYTIGSINPIPASSGFSKVLAYFANNDEPSLQQILNNQGYSINVVNDETRTERWNIPAQTTSISFTGKYIGAYGTRAKTFGYYVNTQLFQTFVPLFKNNLNDPADVPVFSGGESFNFVIPTTGVSSIGFAIRNGSPGIPNFFATQSQYSLGADQVAIFNPSLNKYIMGFEDNLANGLPHQDYQDLVVEVEAVSATGRVNCSDQVQVLMSENPTITVTSNMPSSWRILASGPNESPFLVTPSQGEGVSDIHTVSNAVDEGPFTEGTVTIVGIQNIEGYSYTVTNTQGTSRTMTLFSDAPASFTITYTPTGYFNFSLSSTPDVSVSRNPNQSGQVQQTILVDYISGYASPVILTVINLPTTIVGGVTHTVGVTYANQGCVPPTEELGLPPCNTTLTFTVPYAIPVGTYPITVTGFVPDDVEDHDSVQKSTTFNLIVQPDSSTTASCSVSPTIARIGQPVIWTANPPGGAPNPFVFTWSGTDFPTIETTNPYVTSYQSTGVKTASFTMTNGVTTATCPTVTVYVGVAPDYKEY